MYESFTCRFDAICADRLDNDSRQTRLFARSCELLSNKRDREQLAQIQSTEHLCLTPYYNLCHAQENPSSSRDALVIARKTYLSTLPATTSFHCIECHLSSCSKLSHTFTRIGQVQTAWKLPLFSALVPRNSENCSALLSPLYHRALSVSFDCFILRYMSSTGLCLLNHDRKLWRCYTCTITVTQLL